MVKNELLKKPDTRAVKPELRVQSAAISALWDRRLAGHAGVDELGVVCYNLIVEKGVKYLLENLVFQ